MSTSGGATGASPAGIIEELSKLSVEQIRQVKEQVDGDLSVLQDSANSIKTAANRFESAARSLHSLSQNPNGKKLLVPLTASLYVPGTLQDVEKVLVDVGTGYYIEKTVDEGKDYCERKIQFLKANHEKLSEVAAEKRNVAEQVNMVMQAKLRQVMASK